MGTVIKIGKKLMILILPFFIACPVAITQFPMYFLPGEYAWYKQNQDYAKGHADYCRILIMGDSTAKAAWMPEELSDDSYNFALGGASPAEEYYYLREYLEYNEKPEYIIYSQGAIHFMEIDTLWTGSVYFRRMDWDDLGELVRVLSQYKETASMTVNGEKEIFLYKTCSPEKYSDAFVKGLLRLKRYKENVKKYHSVVADKGQMQFGLAEFYNGMNYYGNYDFFEVNSAIDFYFRKIIELCLDNQIQFVFCTSPINETSYNKIKPRFVEDYENYLNAIQNQYPSLIIDSKLLYYENEYFGDATHLNKRGSIRFSQEMRRKYKYIFEP